MEVTIMNETGTSTEKRQSPRVITSIPARYRELRDDGTEAAGFGSVTCDVSTGGLRFRTKELLSKACRLILELDIPTATKPIQAVSTVAWIQKANTGEYYEVGNQFMEITEKDRELIASYVNSQ
jgi:hypothetical protein